MAHNYHLIKAKVIYIANEYNLAAHYYKYIIYLLVPEDGAIYIYIYICMHVHICYVCVCVCVLPVYSHYC